MITEEFKRMQQLAGIITEMKIGDPTTKIVRYFVNGGETAIFQTVNGINIMKQILDDFNKTHPNNTTAYASIDFDGFNEVVNHPLYNKFKKEGEIAYKILDPLIRDFNGTYDVNLDIVPSAYLPYNDDGDAIYVGPEAYLEDYDEDAWDNLDEYLTKQLGDKYTDTPESWEIFLALIGD